MPQRLVLGGMVLLFWGLIVALGLVLFGGCSRVQPPPPVPLGPVPETHQLFDEDLAPPSFEKLHERYFEPHWM
jgi:hypothetical protein